ncbi:tetratricopeptide repeat protein [Kangiella sp. HZ709]|uniref:tetratricopeptide repeat protein n=1 Tax=Kangiella sp. HZ709 TaxID=2666328 RepID=UPI0012AFECF1|nr:sel1 repeat family protein [Kangiella sp. HZ709]MRX27594.1 hypothetical protein [Kangiella sp. HZ709]
MSKHLTLLFVVSFLFFSTNATANFDKAMKAYDEQQFELAYQVFLKLAKEGNEDAQYNLGLMYLDGVGVEKNLLKAYAWIKVSDESNSFELDLLSEIENDLGKSKASNLNQYYKQLKKTLP